MFVVQSYSNCEEHLTLKFALVALLPCPRLKQWSRTELIASCKALDNCKYSTMILAMTPARLELGLVEEWWEARMAPHKEAWGCRFHSNDGRSGCCAHWPSILKAYCCSLRFSHCFLLQPKQLLWVACVLSNLNHLASALAWCLEQLRGCPTAAT